MNAPEAFRPSAIASWQTWWTTLARSAGVNASVRSIAESSGSQAIGRAKPGNSGLSGWKWASASAFLTIASRLSGERSLVLLVPTFWPKATRTDTMRSCSETFW
ncbi:hypothetical protein D3C72_887410 [compost metagenome]